MSEPNNQSCRHRHWKCDRCRLKAELPHVLAGEAHAIMEALIKPRAV
jgi:hypothetical protein